MRDFNDRTADDAATRTPEDGLSLVELLVAIMVFLVLITMITGLLISVTRATSASRLIDGDTRSVSNAMNEMSRMVRAATENPLLNPPDGVYPNDAAIQAANVRSVTLYAYVNLASSDSTPVKVMFSVNAANQLIETKWAGTTLVNGHWTFSTTALSTRILTSNVVAGPAIFGFQIDDGSAIAIPTAGITDNATLLSIRSVSISLSVKTPVSQSAAVTLQNTIGMPNLGFSNTTGVTS